MEIDNKNSKPIKITYRPGVGAVIFNKDKKVLLCQRLFRDGSSIAIAAAQHDKIPTTLQFPQGGIDSDEDIEKALYREIYEELGLRDNLMIVAQSSRWYSYKFSPKVRPKIYGGKYIGQKQKWFLLYFYGNDNEIDINYHHEPEFSAFYWLDLYDAIQYVVDFKKNLYSEITAEFAPVLQNYTIPDFSGINISS